MSEISSIELSRLLGSLDPDPFGRTVEALLSASTDDKARAAIQEAMTLVQDRLLKRSPALTVEQAKLFERLIPPSFGLLGMDKPAFVEMLLVALHYRATELLRYRGPGELLNYGDLPGRVKAETAQMRPSFLGEFAIQATIGAYYSDEVERRLRASADAIRRALPTLCRLRNQAETVMPLRKGGGDDCSCIVSACNAYGDCQQFCIETWWGCILILLGIIVVIILA